jgi:hypothetical protein
MDKAVLAAGARASRTRVWLGPVAERGTPLKARPLPVKVRDAAAAGVAASHTIPCCPALGIAAIRQYIPVCWLRRITTCPDWMGALSAVLAGLKA